MLFALIPKPEELGGKPLKTSQTGADAWIGIVFKAIGSSSRAR
jgi:hypothetical protein